MNIVKKISGALIATLVLLALPLIGSINHVSATTNTDGMSISIPITTHKTGPVGSTHELSSKPIETTYKNMVCDVKATAHNQESVHPNNNLVVASGSTSVVLKDVERVGGINTTAEGTLTLGDKLTVSLVLGADGAFSGGMDVNVTCKEPEIKICRDGKHMTIKMSERKSTDTNTPCVTPTFDSSIVCSVVDNRAVYKLKINQTAGAKNITFSPKDGTILENGNAVNVTGTYNDGESDKTVKSTAPAVTNCVPERVNVCRDGKVVNIVKSERKDTDKDAPCPEVKATSTVLPKTGAGSVAGIIGATFGISTIAAHLRMRRNASRSGFNR